MPETDAPAPALKDWFNEERFEHIAAELETITAKFDRAAYFRVALPGLQELNLMQRLRRMTESLHAALPGNYKSVLKVLYKLAPRINHNFVTLVLPDFVSAYGLHDFESSMDALKYFTPFGSSEFAVRAFLKQDLNRSLTVMESWSRDPDEAVRRLASEGCRPRLPWSFKLDALVQDPSPALPILENLKADSSLYVRKSVANHLNDITKDHPQWVLDLVRSWDMKQPHTAWIAKRALRTLVKKGDARALALIGAGDQAQVRAENFSAAPRELRLGDALTLSFHLESQSTASQRLVIDYAVHYVKKSGGTSAKVFKWKELTLAAGEHARFAKRQTIKDFTTRAHHPGRHLVQLMVNGQRLAECEFLLK